MTTAEKVNLIFLDSLFKPEELIDEKPPIDFIEVSGVTQIFGFHPTRLESHRSEILEILNLMPDAFHKDRGGGYTFLNLCEDKNGVLWAEHLNMEQLVALAIGLKVGEFCLPRDLWAALPGGLPYVSFDTTAKL